MRLSPAEFEDVGNPKWRRAGEGARIQRGRTDYSRIPGDGRQPLGHKSFGVAQLPGERRRLYPFAAGATLMFHQDFAVFPGLHQLWVGKVVDVLDVVERAVDLAIKAPRRGLAQASAGERDQVPDRRPSESGWMDFHVKTTPTNTRRFVPVMLFLCVTTPD